ncbi:MAG: type II toxin-antitoxin system VapC family toxin [Candidatus Anammoximicrobium sp.]|nr:type II toxin-antitoxin system VapC family toxin [Candidatus Anammoximicrobium sp.]
MKTVFADSFYFLALWNAEDRGHAKALAFTNDYHEAMLTTDWVVVELGDALARPPNRERFLRLFRVLQRQPELTIIPASRSLLHDGLKLYENRPDKDWSLTDCISFVVMQQEGVTEALTGDKHFEQAGFVALLR